jgi:hypothetical protein
MRKSKFISRACGGNVWHQQYLLLFLFIYTVEFIRRTSSESFVCPLAPSNFRGRFSQREKVLNT